MIQKSILYVDNDADDIFLFKRQANKLYPYLTILEASDGQEAITLLNQLKQENKSYPELIILDINMPRMDGRQTLDVLRNHQEWRLFPIVMFTTSSSENDKNYFNSKGVECVTKPLELAEMDEVVKYLLRNIRI